MNVWKGAFALFFTAAVGCSSVTTTATNPMSNQVKPPVIDTIDKIARIELGEPVTGFGCSDDKHLLILPDQFDINNLLDKAKAAAAYDALFGDLTDHPPVYHDKRQPFPNDQLLAPVFHVEERSSWWSKTLCVAVSGYRGRLVQIQDSSKTSRDIRPESVSSVQVISVESAPDAVNVSDSSNDEIQDSSKTSRDMSPESVSSVQVISLESTPDAVNAIDSSDSEARITEEGYQALRRLLINSGNQKHSN
jgi:hypothetical protein